MTSFKKIRRKKKISFKNRVDEIMYPLYEKGHFSLIFEDMTIKCHICGLKTERDLRPSIVKNHWTNPEEIRGLIECIRCTLTGGGDCDIGYPIRWKYADREQMIEVSECRKKWAEHDKYELIMVK